MTARCCPLCAWRPPVGKYCAPCRAAVDAIYKPQSLALLRQAEVEVAQQARYWSPDAQHERLRAAEERWFRSLGLSHHITRERCWEIIREALGQPTPDEIRAKNQSRWIELTA